MLLQKYPLFLYVMDKDNYFVSSNGTIQSHDWSAMVYLPYPQGNFVDHFFLKAYYLASILQHVSHLAMGPFPSISLLHSLALQKV